MDAAVVLVLIGAGAATLALVICWLLFGDDERRGAKHSSKYDLEDDLA
jgi:hypothetical protein